MKCLAYSAHVDCMQLEINLRHEVMQKLFSLKESNPPLAKVVAEQVWVTLSLLLWHLR